MQAAAAKLALDQPKHAASSGTIKELHWHPVKERSTFKSLCVVYKAIKETEPMPFKCYIPPRNPRLFVGLSLMYSEISENETQGPGLLGEGSSTMDTLPASLRASKDFKTWLFPRWPIWT